MPKTLKHRKHKRKVSFRNKPNIHNLPRNNSRGRIRQNYTNTNNFYRLSTHNEYMGDQAYLSRQNLNKKMSILQNASNYINKTESDDVHKVFEGLRIKDKYKKPSQMGNFITVDTNDKYPTPEQYEKIKNYMSNNNSMNKR